jgi:hypothetical protein
MTMSNTFTYKLLVSLFKIPYTYFILYIYNIILEIFFFFNWLPDFRETLINSLVTPEFTIIINKVSSVSLQIYILLTSSAWMIVNNWWISHLFFAIILLILLIIWYKYYILYIRMVYTKMSKLRRCYALKSYYNFHNV